MEVPNRLHGIAMLLDNIELMTAPLCAQYPDLRQVADDFTELVGLRYDEFTMGDLLARNAIRSALSDFISSICSLAETKKGTAQFFILENAEMLKVLHVWLRLDRPGLKARSI